jgi:hypothetical protein
MSAALPRTPNCEAGLLAPSDQLSKLKQKRNIAPVANLQRASSPAGNAMLVAQTGSGASRENIHGTILTH